MTLTAPPPRLDVGGAADRIAALARDGRGIEVDRGGPERFAGLFSYAAIERVLRRYSDAWGDRTARKRLSVVQRDFVDPVHFLVADPEGGRPRVDATRFNARLRAGASIVMVDAHTVDPGLAALAAAVSDRLGEPVKIRVFASFGALPVFRRHIDSFDTVIVQLVGPKHWSVVEPSARHPRREPTAPPVWEGLVTAGDLMVVPRGWWHLVAGVGEPALHLSVDVHRRRGTGVLARLAAGAAGTGAARPLVGAAADAAATVARLQDAVRAAAPAARAAAASPVPRQEAVVRPETRPAVAGRAAAGPALTTGADVLAALARRLDDPTGGHPRAAGHLGTVAAPSHTAAALVAGLTGARGADPEDGICLPWSALAEPVTPGAPLTLAPAGPVVAAPGGRVVVATAGGPRALDATEAAVAEGVLAAGGPHPVAAVLARSPHPPEATCAALSALVRDGVLLVARDPHREDA